MQCYPLQRHELEDRVFWKTMPVEPHNLPCLLANPPLPNATSLGPGQFGGGRAALIFVAFGDYAGSRSSFKLNLVHGELLEKQNVDYCDPNFNSIDHDSLRRQAACNQPSCCY